METGNEAMRFVPKGSCMSIRGLPPHAPADEIGFFNKNFKGV